MYIEFMIVFIKKEDEIVYISFEILKNIVDLKNLIVLNDVSVVFVYIFRNVEFRKLILKLKIFLF